MTTLAVIFLLVSAMTNAGNYSAEQIRVDGIEVVRLTDRAHNTEVSVVPSIGNNAYEMNVGGKNIFWSPYQSLKELKDKPVQLGNPFLAPWANRIDGDAFWANGKKYLFNPDLNNFRYGANHKPIHGLLVYASEWKVVDVTADANSARVTSRLEFWRRPDWMAQFPFAHTITTTYRLRGGALEVETTIENLSSEAMPLSLGYHTYYRLSDSPRDDWKIHVGARDHMILSDALIPTGERKPVTLADPQALRDFKLDDVFAGLMRDSEGRAEFWVQGKDQKIRVLFGRKFDVGVVFAPPGRDFVCFEPMVGITNAFNLSHAGLYKDLQSIPPGGTWKESFWIIPEGFH
jgi:aldose 1-epimerase